MDIQETLEELITEGLWAVVKRRTSNKSPGEEGICHEFYVSYWETDMAFYRCIMEYMKTEGRGHCIPKRIAGKCMQLSPNNNIKEAPG